MSLLQKYLLSMSFYLLALVMWGLVYVIEAPIFIALVFSVPSLVAFLVAFCLHRLRFNDLLTIIMVVPVPILVAELF